MTEQQRLEVVLDLLEGKTSAEQLALKHSVAASDLLAWRALYLAGLRQANAARVSPPRLRWGMKAGGVAAAVVIMVGGAAWAQLIPMVANAPALASDVNSNFNQLQTWLVSKVGTASDSRIRIANSEDVGSTGSVGAVVLGNPTGLNLALDPDEMQARSGNNTSGLVLQRRGGNLTLGNASTTTSMPGNLAVSGTASAGTAGEVSASSNSWGSNNTTATYNKAATVQSMDCPNGQFMCGIIFEHNFGENGTHQERVALKCCTL